jgi:hypothetical protein
MFLDMHSPYKFRIVDMFPKGYPFLITYMMCMSESDSVPEVFFLILCDGHAPYCS